MKKTLILLSLLFVVLSAQAQYRSTNTHHLQEVRLGLGIAPVYWRTGDRSIQDIDYSKREFYSKIRIYTPAINATYSYRFTRYFALEGTASYITNYEKFYDLYSDDKLSTDSRTRLSIVPVARFYWNDPSRLVSIYSSIGLGAVFIYSRNISGYAGETAFLIRPIFHISPIGISVGRQVFGFAELGISNMGILHFGVGYRFNYKK